MALAFPLPARTREVITVEQFRALSARLTGASPDALDVGAAAKLLDGFVSMGRGADLARLAADPGATGPLADDIVAAWYSGTYHTRNGLASFCRHASLGRPRFHQAARAFAGPRPAIGQMRLGLECIAMIIVGSGIWGELLAAKRSAAGVKVAILEAGATGQSHGGDAALLGRTDQGP